MMRTKFLHIKWPTENIQRNCNQLLLGGLRMPLVPGNLPPPIYSNPIHQAHHKTKHGFGRLYVIAPPRCRTLMYFVTHVVGFDKVTSLE